MEEYNILYSKKRNLIASDPSLKMHLSLLYFLKPELGAKLLTHDLVSRQ
jgi:hypothetical protein